MSLGRFVEQGARLMLAGEAANVDAVGCLQMIQDCAQAVREQHPQVEEMIVATMGACGGFLAANAGDPAVKAAAQAEQAKMHEAMAAAQLSQVRLLEVFGAIIKRVV